jgi:signal transduction histidine kinase
VVRVQALAGTRTDALQDLVVPVGYGLGGKVAAMREPASVEDYCKSQQITHHFNSAVIAEGLKGVLAVPITSGGRFYGVIYGAEREASSFGGRRYQAAVNLADQAALALDLVQRTDTTAEAAVHDERRRIAVELHDSVGALLFGIGAAVSDLRSLTGDSPELSSRLSYIEEKASAASAALRESLRALSDAPEEVALAATLRGDCRAFQERTGITARTVVLGSLPLDATRQQVLLQATREALLNIEKHAHARSVVVSLYSLDDGCAVAISDDGQGLASDGRPGIGLTAARQRLEQLGGSLLVVNNEDGGLTLRAWVPC